MSQDLFGDEPTANPMVRRPGEPRKRQETRPQGYAGIPGTGPAGKACRDCAHARRCGAGHSRQWWKCDLVRGKWTGGRGSDILATAPACSRFEQEPDRRDEVESDKPDAMFGALFSPCKDYRYRLWRRFSWSGNRTTPYRDVAFLMLNPSTADATSNDPTVERCERRARDMGYEGLQVVNLFAWRSTNPKALALAVDPVGPDNDAAILEVCRSAALVICAWGAHGKLMDRGAAVTGMLRAAGLQLHALRINADGTPAHPLYLPYDVRPEPMP